MNDSIWVVTLTEGDSLINQCAFESYEKAEEKSKELHSSLYLNAFNETKEEFDEGATFMDFQQSEAWWDADCRTMVHLYEASLE